MSDIETAIKTSKRLESLLTQMGAQGRGLHEKVSDVERKLPPELVKKLRFIATVRNKIVHDETYDKIDDRAGFKQAAKDAEAQLKKLAGIKSSSWKKWLVLIFILMNFAAVAFVLWLLMTNK